MSGKAHGALPAELTSFVGRRQQLAEIRRMLSSSRLLTLTGTGGAGKTRLALRTATEMRRAFPGGVWFIELAALRDPELLPHAIASTLDLHHVSENPLADLADHLHDKQLLMVLDNCEHLTDACAVVVSKLLAEAPGLRVLATSRQVLDVEGEQILAVPPLSTPEEADVHAGEVLHYESVTLLVDRARAVDPEFQIVDENRQAVIEICRRLDGLPLALELAAVWLRTLSPAQILERLEDRFQMLTAGRRGGPERHQALDATVAWSFDLCSPQEQVLWARLSVFSGGFDLEAAEEVCAGEDISRGDVLALLAGLVNKSIVVRHHDMEQADSWYQMLGMIREYAARRLSAEQADEIRLRHRDHYRTLATRFGAEFFTSHQAGWFLRLRREEGNVRAALEFCLGEPREAAAALDIAGPLWPWWHAGHLHEGLRHLQRALDLAPAPTRSRGFALFAASNRAIHLSEFDRALRFLAESGELAERVGDELLAARVRQAQGHALVHSGHAAEAVPLLEAARDDARRLGEARDEWRAVNLLSLALMFLGDPGAEDVAREAVAKSEEHGAQASTGWSLWSLGLTQWRVGRHQEAIQTLREGIRRFQPMRNLDGVSMCVQALAWCATSFSSDEDAARLLGAAEAVWRSIGGNDSQAVYREFDHRSEAQLRSAIGDELFESAFAEGAAHSLEQAVDLALAQGSARPRPRATPSVDAKVEVPGALTSRQWEVAQLVAEGLSNKEVAARLVISQRTAETHVENILTKLGFNSRIQLSRWVLEEPGR
jgi:predicted ATPase/DNA-binding CsgD family transcriptional regulator